MIAKQRLINILAIARHDLWVVVVYGLAVGFFSLIIPIAAQSLVTLVSFGTVIQPIFLLALLVFLLLSAAAGFRILQNILAENIQQRIFTHIALKLAFTLAKVKLSVFETQRGTELVNRFLDVVSIQKTTASLIVTGIGVFLQAAFGLILLAFYHPILLIFDLVFIISLWLAVYLPSKKAVITAIDESTEKYRVVAWLEEMARLPLTFKFQQMGKFAIQRCDKSLVSYLKVRQSHFRHLLKHISSTYAIQVLASSGLLLIGGLLVINNQLTLGQLVAAEIVINALGSSVSRLGVYLENIYDLVASADKVGYLLELPLETLNDKGSSLFPSSSTSSSTSPTQSLAPSLTIKSLNISLIQNNSLCIIAQRHDSNKLINSLIGLSSAVTPIEINQKPIELISMRELREQTGLIRELSLFDATIRENMGNDELRLQKLIKQFSLEATLAKLDHGLDSEYLQNKSRLDIFSTIKILLIRTLLKNPIFLIIDGAFDLLSEEEARFLLSQLKLIQEQEHQANNHFIWILSTQHSDLDPQFTSLFTQTVSL